jgi:tryptophan-rich sensory protein
METNRPPEETPPEGHGSLAMFLALVFTTLLIGGLGALATARGVTEWYPTLAKPSFNPPNGVFGPVWTTLYLLMAYSMWLVWDAPGHLRKVAQLTFGGMLVANALWSLLFFGLHRPGLALVDLVLYLILLTLWYRQLRALDRLAARLQLPHLAWLLFAGALNASIWWLNQ